VERVVSIIFANCPSVLKNSLHVRFRPRLGTKYSDFGAL
jgi:hypothetical protein